MAGVARRIGGVRRPTGRWSSGAVRCPQNLCGQCVSGMNAYTAATDNEADRYLQQQPGSQQQIPHLQHMVATSSNQHLTGYQMTTTAARTGHVIARSVSPDDEEPISSTDCTLLASPEVGSSSKPEKKSKG